MTIGKAASLYGEITPGTYEIGFMNNGLADKAEFDVCDLDDLEELYLQLCMKNRLAVSAVLYVRKIAGLTVKDLNRSQLNQLKEALCAMDATLENRGCSIDELLTSHDRITDEEVYEYFDGTLFSEEDFYS